MKTHRRENHAVGERLQLVERDVDILTAVWRHQFLTVEEIQPLFFSVERGYPAAARRLKKLSDAGLLARNYTPTFGGSPAIYAPTKAGIALLLERQRITPAEMTWRGKHNRLTPETTRHDLCANRLVVALMVAIAGRYRLWRAEAWPHRAGGKRTVQRVDMQQLEERLHVERGSHLWDGVANPEKKDRQAHPNLPIRPDWLLVLKGDDHWKNFFLEVEMAPKSRDRFRRRVRAYRAYYQSGGFLKRYGEGDDPGQYPFTVLVTVSTEERRNNLIELAIGEGCLRTCWFAVYEEALANPLGKVWVSGEAYQSAMGTLSSAALNRLYRTHRRLERDGFVRETVRTRSLLEA